MKIALVVICARSVSRIRNCVCVESIGAFHGVAPAGMFVDVVVCIPFCHFQVMVSPATAFTFLGLNRKSDTLTCDLPPMPQRRCLLTMQQEEGFFS